MAKLPTIKQLSELFKILKPQIGDEYRAGPDDDIPGMQVTIGWSDESGDWSYQTGDNSYTGGAYSCPHWAVVSLYRRSSVKALSRDVREQLRELAAQ